MALARGSGVVLKCRRRLLKLAALVSPLPEKLLQLAGRERGEGERQSRLKVLGLGSTLDLTKRDFITCKSHNKCHKLPLSLPLPLRRLMLIINKPGGVALYKHTALDGAPSNKKQEKQKIENRKTKAKQSKRNEQKARTPKNGIKHVN